MGTVIVATIVSFILNNCIRSAEKLCLVKKDLNQIFKIVGLGVARDVRLAVVR